MNTLKIQSHGRITFRPTAVTDLDFVLENERHPENNRFIRQWSPQQHLDALDNPNIGHFIIETTEGRKAVGHLILVGLTDTDLSLEFRRIVIAEKKRGYGGDAVRQVMRLAFEQLSFHRLWLDVMKDNRRAYKLYRSLGFSVEGIHRQAARQGNSFKDLMVMSVLRREYFCARQRYSCATSVVFPDGERPGQLCIG